MTRVSIVFSARNDDYGGNFLHRINTCLRVLNYHASRYPGALEIVIVEYNPPAHEKPLTEVLTTRSTAALPIRVITVPQTFHAQQVQKSKIPFLEYIAKNIGIRRAHGEYILSANPDIVFSEAMLDYLARGALNSQTFYRANRHDISGGSFRDEPSVSEIEHRAPRLATRVLTVRGVRYVSTKRWLKRLTRHPNLHKLILCPALNHVRDMIWDTKNHDGLHTGAAGDFVMAHRDAWGMVRGFDQMPFNSFIDAYNIYMFVCAGLHQYIIPHPIYHINHETSNNIRPMADSATYYEATRAMWQTRIPYKIYPENWGFPNEQFAETSS